MSRHTPPVLAPLGEAQTRSLNDGDLQTPMELNEFMTELGSIMQLPRKTTVRMRAVADVAPQARRRLPLLPALAVAAVLGLGLSSLWPSTAPSVLPLELVGEWRASDARYAERRLAFSPTGVGIILRQGQAAEWHPVESVVTTLRGDTTSYDVQYDDDGAPVRFLVHRVTRPGPRLLLSNPPGVVFEPVNAPR